MHVEMTLDHNKTWLPEFTDKHIKAIEMYRLKNPTFHTTNRNSVLLDLRIGGGKLLTKQSMVFLWFYVVGVFSVLV